MGTLKRETEKAAKRRLQQAAPELLSALKACADLLESHVRRGGPKAPPPGQEDKAVERNPVLAMAMAALARVRP